MKRVLILAYGLIVYVLFFATFLYLIGFVSGLAPISVDGGAAGSEQIGLAVTINLGLIGLFGLQHAVMARPGFKRWWTTIVPTPVERSTFVLATVAVLWLMFWQWRGVNVDVWRVENAAGRAVLWSVHFAGWGMVLLSTFLIDHFDLFGVRQVVLAWRKRDYTHRPFVARSLYRLVRHPLMLGFLIAFWATPTMTGGRLIFALGMTAYILIGIRMEERDLVKQHGAAYEQYRRTTPALLLRVGGGVSAPAGAEYEKA